MQNFIKLNAAVHELLC